MSLQAQNHVEDISISENPTTHQRITSTSPLPPLSPKQNDADLPPSYIFDQDVDSDDNFDQPTDQYDERNAQEDPHEEGQNEAQEEERGEHEEDGHLLMANAAPDDDNASEHVSFIIIPNCSIVRLLY